MRWTAKPVSFQWKLKKKTDNKALKIGIVIGRVLGLAEIQSYLIQEKMARLAKPNKKENFETGGVVVPNHRSVGEMGIPINEAIKNLGDSIRIETKGKE